jgi:predicted O-methyltransferase YrrM
LNFFLLKEYLRYFHFKTDEHSLHSPFFYQFYDRLIKQKSHSKEWNTIEGARNKLLNDTREIKLNDLGAGSKVEKSDSRTIKSIAKHSLSSPKFSQFLYTLIRYMNFTTIIELGTSLGINSAYLASANPTASLFTFEADPSSMKIAKGVNSARKNIQYFLGDIANLLPEMLNENKSPIDLVYADANHTYKASIDYFTIILPNLSSNSIYILDDIHWSASMKKAWEELKGHAAVTTSIDLFDAGLLFFNPDFQKQHYILDF